MTSPARRALLALFLAALLSPLLSPRAEEPMATEPEECVFLAAPSYNGLDCMPEENLFLLSNQDGIRAFDIRSGEQRWHHPRGGNVEWGGKHVVGWTSQNQLFLLDKACGQERWFRKEDGYGDISWALLSPDAKRILAVFDSEPGKVSTRLTTVLYDVESRRQRVFSEMKNAFPQSFLSDGKTALFFRYIVPPTATSMDQQKDWPKEFFLVDLDSGRASETHAVPNSPWGGLSASGLFVMAGPRKDGPASLKVVDAKSGALVRDLGEIPESFGRPVWSADEKCLYFMTLDRQKACVLDAQTGAVQQSLCRPGHKLCSVRIQRPDEGPDMVLSQDEDNNVWLWPPTPDATPTKVFDGFRFVSGPIGVSLNGDGQVLVRNTEYSPVTGKPSEQYKLTAYQIEGLRRCGTWLLPTKSLYSMYGFANRTMTHFADVTCKEAEPWKPENRSYAVYAESADGPICSGPGNPLALSPDGRFLVAQADGQSVVLRDMSAKGHEAVCSFSVKSDYCDSVNRGAVFSEDGTRVAVGAYPNVEIVYLTDGYPRRTLVPEKERDLSGDSFRFSPNGKLLIAGGYGRASLYDADSGALLHVFEETERYAETWRGWGGETLDGIANRARDWAGLVTDRFKTTKHLEGAFGNGGATIITHAVGQIIRVWDGNTYALLQTIKTELPEKRNSNGDIIQNMVVLNPLGDYAFCYNRSNAGPASLWSLNSGALVRRYKLSGPFQEGVAVTNDGTAVYMIGNGQLYRWAGRPKDEM